MYYDGWIDGYKVRIMPWVKDDLIYVNVLGYNGGDALSRPRFDKSVWIKNNSHNLKIMDTYRSTLINYIAQLNIKMDERIILDFSEQELIDVIISRAL